MGVTSRKRLPVPNDAAWQAEEARKQAEVQAAVDKVEGLTEHLGNMELERRAAEAARRYAQKLFLHEHKEAIRALKERAR